MGELYALGSALCFAVSNVTISRGAPKGAAENGAFLSLLTTGIAGACWLALGAMRGFAPVSGEALLWMAGAGVLTAFVGRVFLYASVQHLGAVRATAVKRLNPLLALLLGVVVLGEAISGWAWGGGVVLVLASFALLVHAQLAGSEQPGSGAPGAWRELLNLGYLCGPVSALGHAAGYLLRKCGLRETPDPFRRWRRPSARRMAGWWRPAWRLRWARSCVSRR